MAAISSLGVGSNLDLTSLLDQLTTAESVPLTLIQKQQTSYTTKLSAYGYLQGALGSFQTAAAKLADPTLFQGVSAVSSASNVLNATATSQAAAGNYQIDVTQLAQAQTLAAAGVADQAGAIGKGTVTIDFGTIAGGTLDAASGTYSGASFSADAARAPTSIVIDDSNNSLQGLRDAINQKTGLGVVATIVNDGSGTPYRLVLTSSQTGQASSMRIAVTGDASLGNLMNNDPAGTQNLQQTSAAASAALKVNGIAVTSATNTVSGAIGGVTLTLAGTGTSSLAVGADSSLPESAVSAFVNAYNSLQSTVTQLSSYDSSTKQGAALLGDSTLRNIQTRIRDVLNTPQAGQLKVLSNVGVTFQTDGTLAFDSSKFRTAYAAGASDVGALFSGAAGSGYGTQLSSLVTGFTSTGGLLASATTGVQTTLTSLDKQYTDMQTRVDAKVAAYRTQFQQLDSLMASMNSTSNYLTQQFAAMTASTK